jgi:hypothetical protein
VPCPRRSTFDAAISKQAAAISNIRSPLCSSRHRPQSVAACLSIVAGRILSRMGTKSRETIYGASVRAAAERATEARKDADRLAWYKRSHLVALRATKISTNDPPSTWWPGER